MHQTLAIALAPFAPPNSEVRRIAADVLENDRKAQGMSNTRLHYLVEQQQRYLRAIGELV
jgi:hypothetical protein